MIRLATIIETFESEFLAEHGDRLLPGQRYALAAMRNCRSARSPKMQAQCIECEEQVLVPHSCGHRTCSHCQHHESQQWLERQLKKQVPGNYFLLTFTLPAELRPLAWRHQRVIYDLMMQCSWDTVRTFASNDKQLNAMPGAISVLHTHSRRLDYHPHVHLVMPAGALDAKNRLWRTKRMNKQKGKTGYLFNHKALAKVFRAKMLEGLYNAGLVLPARFPDKWIVDCKGVGNGEKVLVYLGRYLYRGVIQEKDIVSCANGQVTFRYKDSKTGRLETRTVSGPAFLSMLLRHVLPKGFRRARNFGFLHPNSKRLIRLLQIMHNLDTSTQVSGLRKRPTMSCKCCGADMRILRTRIMPPLSKAFDPPDSTKLVAVM